MISIHQNQELQAHTGGEFQLSQLGTAEIDSFALVSSMVKGNENCHEHQKSKIHLIIDRAPEWMEYLIFPESG